MEKDLNIALISTNVDDYNFLLEMGFKNIEKFSIIGRAKIWYNVYPDKLENLDLLIISSNPDSDDDKKEFIDNITKNNNINILYIDTKVYTYTLASPNFIKISYYYNNELLNTDAFWDSSVKYKQNLKDIINIVLNRINEKNNNKVLKLDHSDKLDNNK